MILNTGVDLSPVGNYMVEAFRSMFYLRGPQELALDGTDKLPQFMLQHGIPMFFFFILVEWIIIKARDALRPRRTKDEHPLPGYRLNDFVSCSLLGSFQQISVSLTCGLRLVLTPEPIPRG